MRCLQRIFSILLSLFFVYLPLTTYADTVVPPKCTVCILEFQTHGATGDESEDFITIQNISPTNLTGNLQLQYLNSLGILDSSISLGTMNAGIIKTFVSDSLKATNASAASLAISFANAGGVLRLVKAASSINPTPITVYDQVSWGTGVPKEGQTLSILSNGQIFARKRIRTIIQDTDNNGNDFETVSLSCRGAAINEIQPFVTDENGNATDAWVELAGTQNSNGDCLLLTASGDVYTLPAADLPIEGELRIINRGIDSQNQVMPLHLGSPNGQIWIAGVSQYGGATATRIPFTTQTYTNLLKGQSWAYIDNIWRRTYNPTADKVNIYQQNPVVINDDPTACETVRITELLPNPAGEDTHNEWLEIYNQSDSAAVLRQCLVDIGGTQYNFLADDVLGAREWRTFTSLHTSDGDDKPISLRNTGETLVALQRIRPAAPETIQSFVYSDSPENQSWARFDNGWSWTYALTPGSENILQTSLPMPKVTELPAASSSPGSSGSNGAGNTNITSPSVVITELLPNPAPPQTDENDEFIELYNLNPAPISLDGYKVQTGSNYTYSFTLDHQSIPANGYLVLTSGATGLSLSNTAGRARLLDPAGNILSETDAYKNADSGVAWAFVDGKWQWTTTPTAGSANIFNAVLSASTTSKSPKNASSSTKKASSKTASTASKATKSKNITQTGSGANPKDEKTPVHVSIIAAVGGVALLYGAYEYRGDMANWLYRFKRYRKARRANRP